MKSSFLFLFIIIFGVLYFASENFEYTYYAEGETLYIQWNPIPEISLYSIYVKKGDFWKFLTFSEKPYAEIKAQEIKGLIGNTAFRIDAIGKTFKRTYYINLYLFPFSKYSEFNEFAFFFPKNNITFEATTSIQLKWDFRDSYKNFIIEMGSEEEKTKTIYVGKKKNIVVKVKPGRKYRWRLIVVRNNNDRVEYDFNSFYIKNPTYKARFFFKYVNPTTLEVDFKIDGLESKKIYTFVLFKNKKKVLEVKKDSPKLILQNIKPGNFYELILKIEDEFGYSSKFGPYEIPTKKFTKILNFDNEKLELSFDKGKVEIKTLVSEIRIGNFDFYIEDNKVVVKNIKSNRIFNSFECSGKCLNIYKAEKGVYVLWQDLSNSLRTTLVTPIKSEDIGTSYEQLYNPRIYLYKNVLYVISENRLYILSFPKLTNIEILTFQNYPKTLIFTEKYLYMCFQQRIDIYELLKPDFPVKKAKKRIEFNILDAKSDQKFLYILTDKFVLKSSFDLNRIEKIYSVKDTYDKLFLSDFYVILLNSNRVKLIDLIKERER